jgi:DNA replication protein DnaC
MRERRLVQHPGALPGCAICHGGGTRVIEADEGAVARPCSCVGRCPLCQGLGMRRESDQPRAPVSPCVCREVQRRQRLFDEAGIPRRYALATRGSFRPQDLRQQQVMIELQRWLGDFAAGDAPRGLVLWGDVGRGKTHLLASLIRELTLDQGVSCRFIEFSHLVADAKAGFDEGRGLGVLLAPLSRVTVLALDELGKGRATEFEQQVLDELISRRYNASLPLLTATNYRPGPAEGRLTASAAEGRQVSLADRVGDRVYSRLRETCDFVQLTGEDYRERARRPGRPRAGG